MFNFRLNKKELPINVIENVIHASYELLFRNIDFWLKIENNIIFIEGIINNYAFTIILKDSLYKINYLGNSLDKSNCTFFEYFENILGTKLLGIKPSKVSPYILDLIGLLIEYLPSFDLIKIKKGYIILIKYNSPNIYIKDKFYNNHYLVLSSSDDKVIYLEEFDRKFRECISN